MKEEPMQFYMNCNYLTGGAGKLTPLAFQALSFHLTPLLPLRTALCKPAVLLWFEYEKCLVTYQVTQLLITLCGQSIKEIAGWTISYTL
jgi:hypothetical protein